MTDLERDLEELSTTLPTLPVRLQELLQEAQGLSAAVSSLEENLRAAGLDFTQSRSAAQSVLPDLAKQLQSARERLGASWQGVTQAWQAAHDDLEEAVDGVERSADGAETAGLDLQRGLAGWTSRAIAASPAPATLEVVAAASETAQHVEATVAAVDEQGAALRSAVDTLLQALQADAHALWERVLQVTTTVRGDAMYLAGEEMLRRLGDDSRVRNVAADEVESRAAAIEGDVEQQVQSGVVTPLRGAVERMTSVLTGSAGAATHYAQALSEARVTLLASLAEVQDATAPLPDVYAEVEETTRRISEP
jgi:predicted  nucleic acid-binding Zn-ribbon protein